jgi:hypothetical protein
LRHDPTIVLDAAKVAIRSSRRSSIRKHIARSAEFLRQVFQLVRQVDGKVPTTFSDMGEVVLKNISRPVRVYRANLGKESTDRAPSPAITRDDLPTIAVMPFSNLSGDPEQEFFADGLAEDIITTLPLCMDRSDAST